MTLAGRPQTAGVSRRAMEWMARSAPKASGIDPRSTGLFRKMGAVREAHLRLTFVRGNEVLDEDLWAILKTDWRGVRPVPGHVASAAGGQRW